MDINVVSSLNTAKLAYQKAEKFLRPLFDKELERERLADKESRHFKSVQESREIRALNNTFNYEMKGENLGGQKIRRFTNKSPSAVFAGLGSNIATFTAFVEQQMERAGQVTLENLKAVRDFILPPTYRPATDNFHAHFEFDRVSAQVASGTDFTIDYQLEDITRVQNGTFMGPLREEMASLKSAFDKGQVNDYEFQREAMYLRGVLFSKDHQSYAVSEDVLNNIRASFNGGLQSHPVLVFREAAIQPVTTLKPPAPEIKGPAFAPAH